MLGSSSADMPLASVSQMRFIVPSLLRNTLGRHRVMKRVPEKDTLLAIAADYM